MPSVAHHPANNHTPDPAARLSRCTVAGLALVTVLLTWSLMSTPAAAATRTLSVSDGRTVTSESLGSIGHATARASFAIPAKRPSSMTIGLELRKQPNGDRYRVRGTVTRSGVTTVAILRYRGSKATVLSQKRLATEVRGGQRMWLEGSVSGSKPVVVAVRGWVSGKAKPGWQRTVKDGSVSRVASAGNAYAVVGLASASGKKKITVALSGTAIVQHKPSASTTGVPAGTKLRVHTGNIVVRKAGTKLDRLDIHGFVLVKAPNVTISRSIVRGGKNPTTAQGVITNYGYKNLVISDTDVRTSYPSVYLDGIKGWNFTARRVHVVGGVDSIKIHGDNVSIEESLLENTKWYASDPYQDGGPTHNDNVQILKGRHLTVKGNTIRGAQNFAVLGAANLGHVPDLRVQGNWLDGGHCTLKLQTMKSQTLRADVIGNRFGPHRAVSYCPIQVLAGVNLTARDNTSELTGKPVQIWRKP